MDDNDDDDDDEDDDEDDDCQSACAPISFVCFLTRHSGPNMPPASAGRVHCGQSVCASAFHCVCPNPTSSGPIIPLAFAGRVHCGQSVRAPLSLFERFLTQQIPGLVPPRPRRCALRSVSVCQS